MKMSVRLLAAALLLAGSATYASADTTWTLSDVFFSDGTGDVNEASGSFTTNGAVDAIDSFSIVISVISGSDSGAAFTATEMFAAGYLPTSVGIGDGPFSIAYTDLFFSSALTAAGGTVPISSADDCGPVGHCLTLLTGEGYDPEVTGVVTPEPLSLLLFGTGLVAIMGIARRKLRA
jgi:hypothetical protein